MANERYQPSGRSCIIAREGWIFIFLFGIISVLFFALGLWPVGLLILLLSLFTVYFFRNPERVAPDGDDLIIAPADGRVVEVTKIGENPYTNGPAKKIGIFMSVFNVHVNRSPMAGEVQNIQYHPGKFLVASRSKASSDNERNAILLDVGRGSPLAVVQIAGLVARRIVCYLSSGSRVEKGERLGLIRFGSRVDLYLPVDAAVHVLVGDRVKGGLTIVGRFE